MKIRDFWKSWEFGSGVAVIVAIGWLLPFGEAVKLISLALNAYVLSRTIYKKNRCFNYSSTFASEAYAFALNEVFLLYGAISSHVDRLDACRYMFAAYAVFAVCRGVTKHLVPSMTKTVVMR